MILTAVVIAVVGCTQEDNQVQTPDETSEEITNLEPLDSEATVEHFTLKPDTSEAASVPDPDTVERSTESETPTVEEGAEPAEPTESETPAVDESESAELVESTANEAAEPVSEGDE